jgi:NAD(P)-dependent dehydrogenase (short-subunit alcohol dehydrogenase family)
MNIVITGGSGGIGRAIVGQLAGRSNAATIIATYNRKPGKEYPNVTWQQLDLTDESAVRDWTTQTGDIDWLINTAGMLHNSVQGPEKSIRHIDPDFFLENMRINVLPTLLLARHLHSRFRHGRPAVFAAVSAKVGSLHPGTTDTALSKPFQKNIPPGQLFAPGQTASYLLDVLDGLTPAQSGQFLAFDGESLPW